MDIGVAYKENLDHVYEVIRRVGDELKNDLVWQKHILEVIEIAGVEQLGDFAVIIKSRIKVVALEQNPVRREFLGRIKTAFDQEGIQIPSPDFRKK